MAKEIKTNGEVQNAAPAAAEPTTNRERMLANLRKKYPDVEDEDGLYGKAMEGYDAEHDYAKQARKDADELAGIINQYPEVASFYSDLSSGSIGSALLNLGDLVDAYRNGDIDDAGYRAKIAERKKADDDAKIAEDELNSKIAAQDEIFVKWCESKGYDPQEWMNKASERLLKPMSEHAMAEAQFDALDKMINYEDDVNAAEVRGRNANISAQRKKTVGSTDGLASGGSVSARVSAQRRPRTIFDTARGDE